MQSLPDPRSTVALIAALTNIDWLGCRAGLASGLKQSPEVVQLDAHAGLSFLRQGSSNPEQKSLSESEEILFICIRTILRGRLYLYMSIIQMWICFELILSRMFPN